MGVGGRGPYDRESEGVSRKIICNEGKLRGPHKVQKTLWGKEQTPDSKTARTVCVGGDVKGDLRRARNTRAKNLFFNIYLQLFTIFCHYGILQTYVVFYRYKIPAKEYPYLWELSKVVFMCRTVNRWRRRQAWNTCPLSPTTSSRCPSTSENLHDLS